MGIKKNMEEPDDLDQRIEALEKKLDRLRQLFEQYFLGIEKRPPLQLQQEVVRIVREIGHYHIRKTALKFRYTALAQRFNVHRAYWTRTVREIEEGTYRRDRARANRREIARSGEKIDSAELAKRALLERMKGEKAVEEREKRFSREASISDIKREAYVPAIARKKQRRRKKTADRSPEKTARKSASDIRGAPAEELVERKDELQDAHRRVEALKSVNAVTTFGSRRPGEALQKGESPQPDPSDTSKPPAPLPASPFGDQRDAADGAAASLGKADKAASRRPARLSEKTPASPFDVVKSPVFDASPPPTRKSKAKVIRRDPKPAGAATASKAPKSAPSLGAPPKRKPTATARPKPTTRPTPPPTTKAKQSGRASSVLENAGLGKDRARRIYDDLISARKQCGQPVENLSYERIVESMARQVPKLKESHGVRKVDFDVVTKGDKVFLKPKTK